MHNLMIVTNHVAHALQYADQLTHVGARRRTQQLRAMGELDRTLRQAERARERARMTRIVSAERRKLRDQPGMRLRASVQ